MARRRRAVDLLAWRSSLPTRAGRIVALQCRRDGRFSLREQTRLLDETVELTPECYLVRSHKRQVQVRIVPRGTWLYQNADWESLEKVF
jgi:hypothetical protein